MRLALWGGTVWLNMHTDAPPLEHFLGPILDNLAPYHFENMLLAKHQTVLLEANWKTVRDNFLEQYHVDSIHPQHASLVDCCNSHNIVWPYGHSATLVEGYVTNSRYPVPQKTPDHLVTLLQGIGLVPQAFDARVPDIRQAVQQRKRELGRELGFDYSGLSDARRGLTLNPRLIASRVDDRPEHEVFTAADVIAGRHSLTITLDQDICYLADMQAGMHSRGFERAVLNQDEVRVQHFHEWVAFFLAENVV